VSAIAVQTAAVPDSLPAALCFAAGVPVVSDLRDLVATVANGERVIVDGDAGILRIRPTAVEIARVRNQKNRPL
jgi:signal transduction protein with GAF and PtsI domain